MAGEERVTAGTRGVQAVRKQHGVKGRTTKATVTMLDPVKEKAAQAKLEEQKNRDRWALRPSACRQIPIAPAS